MARRAVKAPQQVRTLPTSPTPADVSAEIGEVMQKLKAIEGELGALLQRSLCDTLHATGDLATIVAGTVQHVVGSTFEAAHMASKSLLQAAQRTTEMGRETASDAAATVQDFGRLATEAARQVMRGTAEGLAEIRSSHGHAAPRR